MKLALSECIGLIDGRLMVSDRMREAVLVGAARAKRRRVMMVRFFSKS